MMGKELAAMAAYVRALEERESSRVRHPYDGVLGELPDWFPELDRCDFLRLRNKILDHVWPGSTMAKPATVRKWIEAYRTAGEKNGRCDYWPVEFHEEIGRLAQLYAAFLMGQSGGLAFLLGNDKAKALATGRTVEKGRSNAGKKRGAQKSQQGKQTTNRIQEIEKELRAQGAPERGLNKRIAARLKLSIDHVRRVRKKRT